ncbi:MAG: hypothetical protein QF721_11595 [Verrucomicrobiota bacterium]|nr:hypothetical protein [Verrucomicrobiota bacterium]
MSKMLAGFMNPQEKEGAEETSPSGNSAEEAEPVEESTALPASTVSR